MGLDARIRKMERTFGPPPPSPHVVYYERLEAAELRIYARAILETVDIIGPLVWARAQAIASERGIPYFLDGPEVCRQLLANDTPDDRLHDEAMYLRWMAYYGGNTELKAKDKRWKEGVIGEVLEQAGAIHTPELGQAISHLTRVWVESNHADWNFGSEQQYYTWTAGWRNTFLERGPGEYGMGWLLGDEGWPEVRPNPTAELSALYGLQAH